MQNRSELWQTLAATGTFILETRTIIGETEYQATTAPVISRGLFQDGPAVGNCTAACVQIAIRTEDDFPKSAEVTVEQRLRDATGENVTEWLPVGTFYISKRTRDYVSNIVSLVCFDAMLKANEQYVTLEEPEEEEPEVEGTTVEPGENEGDEEPGENEGGEDSEEDEEPPESEWPKAMTDTVEEIARRLGVEIDERTQIHTGELYVVPYPGSNTLMDVLCAIGGIHGGNWIITPAGKLRLVPLGTAPDSGTEGVENITAILRSLTRGPEITITGITMEDDLGNSYTVGNSDGYMLNVRGGLCATQELCEALFEELADTMYLPFSAAGGIYDPALELGDPIQYRDNVYGILSQEVATLGVAFRGNISSPAQAAEDEDEYPFLSKADKATAVAKEAVVQANDARKVATNYLSRDATGVMVADLNDGSQTPGSATGSNVFIDSQSVKVRQGQKDLATYAGTGIFFDEGTPYKIGNDYTYIDYIDTNEDDVADTLRIVADSVSFRSGADVQDELARLADNVNSVQAETDSLRADTEESINALSGAIDEQNDLISEAQENTNEVRRFININPAVPSIQVGTSDNTYVEITAGKMGFVANGNEAANVGSDQMRIPTATMTTLNMQATDPATGNIIGEMFWVMRSNGHLSLKMSG